MHIVEETRGLIHAERRVPLSPSVAVVTASVDAGEALLETRVELTSRGDRFPWTLWHAEGNSTGRLVIFQTGLGRCIDSAHRATVRRLLDRGLSVATLDWPLHGPRHSPKLSARLLKAIEVTEGDPNGAGLVRYLAQQSALDLQKGLDWTAEQTELSTEHIALLGPAAAAPLLILFAALEPRASVLALQGDPLPSPGPLPDPVELLTESGLDSMLWLSPHPTTPASQTWAEALRQSCPGKFSSEEAAGMNPGRPIAAASALRVCEFIDQALT